MKIYTKTGDGGETSLFGGTRLSKADIRIEAYGTVDETNAHIGYLTELVSDDESRELLIRIQNKLFNIGSSLAVDPAKEIDMPGIGEQDIEVLENAIDEMEKQLPALKAFILPSGHPVGAYCHVARTVCRRAERRVVALAGSAAVDGNIVTYLNRLSDFLFVLSRYQTKIGGGAENLWNSSAE